MAAATETTSTLHFDPTLDLTTLAPDTLLSYLPRELRQWLERMLVVAVRIITAGDPDDLLVAIFKEHPHHPIVKYCGSGVMVADNRKIDDDVTNVGFYHDCVGCGVFYSRSQRSHFCHAGLGSYLYVTEGDAKKWPVLRVLRDDYFEEDRYAYDRDVVEESWLPAEMLEELEVAELIGERVILPRSLFDQLRSD